MMKLESQKIVCGIILTMRGTKNVKNCQDTILYWV